MTSGHDGPQRPSAPLRTGMTDVGDVATSVAWHGTAAKTSQSPAPAHDALMQLTAIGIEPWRELSARAIEPNGYQLADWELAVNASAHGRTNVAALGAWTARDTASPRLIGLLPVISAWRAFHLPLPALVSADPYGTLTTPLLDRDAPAEAVSELLDHARAAGARAVVMRDISLEGPAMLAIRDALTAQGIVPRILRSHHRACLDATRDADDLLRDGLGSKKLKELRRQRNRLAEHGEVAFDVARTPAEIDAAIDTFLTLEASGWKGKRGTALMQNAGDDAFIRNATRALAERGQCELVTLRAGTTPVASGVVLRHLDRAFYFKIGVDERFAKLSPGVQLTVDVTRHLCADPAINSADSTANAGHPMIDPIWRGRLAIGDVLIPLSARDPMVSLIDAALRLHGWGYETLRRVVRALRSRKG